MPITPQISELPEQEIDDPEINGIDEEVVDAPDTPPVQELLEETPIVETTETPPEVEQEVAIEAVEESIASHGTIIEDDTASPKQEEAITIASTEEENVAEEVTQAVPSMEKATPEPVKKRSKPGCWKCALVPRPRRAWIGPARWPTRR